MMNLTKQMPKLTYIDAVGAGLAVVAAAMFYWAAVQPIIDMHNNTVTQQSRVDSNRAEAAKLAASEEGLRTQLSQIRQTIANSTVKLESAASVNREIGRLTEIATGVSLKVGDMQPGEPVYVLPYGCVPIHLTGNGSFGAWTNFAHQLAADCPNVWIDSFQITGKPDNPSTPAEFSVRLVWFVAPQS